MKKAIFLTHNLNQLKSVFHVDKIKQLNTLVDLCEIIITPDNITSYLNITKEAEIIFSTWGMPYLSEEMIDIYFPKLEIVFYAAGSVKGFAEPFLNKGIKVISAYKANAIPTAEFAVSQILLANKGYFLSSALLKDNNYGEVVNLAKQKYPGNYATKVGILGAGAVGSYVIDLLNKINSNLEILVYDPFLSDEKAKLLRVKKSSLTDIFSTCQTISNHLANNEQTIGILNKNHFNKMLETATFINTGRGQQVVEEDLINALKTIPTRTAVLDVTFPEPPVLNSDLYKLSNVILTPHIAGSFGNEIFRMVDYVIEECKRWLNNEELLYSITLEQLKTMA